MKASKADFTYFKPREFFSRNSPATLVFIFAVLFIILGMIISIFSFLMWVGGLFVLAYIIYFLIWLSENKWW